MKKRIAEVRKSVSANKIMIYGAGDITEELLDNLSAKERGNVLAIADRSSLKNGKAIEGIPIVFPDRIGDINPQVIFVNIQSRKASAEVASYCKTNHPRAEVVDLNVTCGEITDSPYLSYPFEVKNAIAQEVTSLRSEPFRLYPRKDGLNIGFLLDPRPLSISVNRSTKIASMGSCFATEIKNWLKFNGFSYLETAKGPAGYAGSAAYHKVFNTFGMLQEFRRAFRSFDPIERVWEFTHGERRILKDPYRRSVAWTDEQSMELELAQHRDNVRKVFSDCDVLILTVGQSEIWYSASDGSVYSQIPPTQVFDPTLHRYRNSTLAENIDNLNAVYALFKENNPGGRIIISLSPVPLNATFQHKNAVIANNENKSMLRCAVSEFVHAHPDDVSYFPSYEIVTLLEPAPYTDDNRHVRIDTIERIMAFFQRYYVRD
jgi:hypothetical protein